MDDEDKMRRFEQAIDIVVSAIVAGSWLISGALLFLGAFILIAGFFVSRAVITEDIPWWPAAIILLSMMLSGVLLMSNGTIEMQRIYTRRIRRL